MEMSMRNEEREECYASGREIDWFSESLIHLTGDIMSINLEQPLK